MDPIDTDILKYLSKRENYNALKDTITKSLCVKESWQMLADYGAYFDAHPTETEINGTSSFGRDCNDTRHGSPMKPDVRARLFRIYWITRNRNVRRSSITLTTCVPKPPTKISQTEWERAISQHWMPKVRLVS
ncbi:hypothetical protein LCGC14_1952510 [marine sediment metagenome]|uniref:Uncharacterized protein n=1 Tax=marine sediment metagenome TaxID=412755 RepID=A0A0F9HVF1_9ZZZZ